MSRTTEITLRALESETDRRRVLEEVLRTQNRVLAQTLSSLIANESEPAKLLDVLLDAITHELEAHSCGVWSFDERTRLATLEKTAFNGNLLKGLSQLRHPQAGRQGKLKSRLFAKALQFGPVEIGDISRTNLLEPEIRRWMGGQRIHSLLCVPLQIGGKMTGALTVRVPKSGPSLPAKAHLVFGLANLVSLAIRLNGFLEQKQETATMQERHRLASEMHDSISQSLTGALLQLEATEDMLLRDPEKARPHLGLGLRLLRQSYEELQRSVWAMRPLALEGHTLAEALRRFAGRLSKGFGLRARFFTRGRKCVLSPDLNSHLLRIAQEAANNAIRHGHATRIEIGLAYSPRRIALTVADDGGGFTVPAALRSAVRVRGLKVGLLGTRPAGAGLGNMRERAARVGARLSIRSGPRRGTQVTVILPIAAP